MAFGPQGMGYDRAITIFSPDGKLYQVEYAFEAVRRGWTTVGVKSKSGVVIAAEKRKITPLMDIRGVEKIFIIDEHVGLSFAGLVADARVLIDYARLRAIQHRLLYDEPIDVEYLTKSVCDIKQAYTQHAGVRPFGVALIIAGVDDKGPRLFMTEPGGQYMSYYAVAIGSGGQAATDFLERNYREDMSLEEMLKLAIQAISKAAEEKLSPEKLEVGYASVEDRKFKKMSEEELEKVLSEVGV